MFQLSLSDWRSCKLGAGATGLESALEYVEVYWITDQSCSYQIDMIALVVMKMTLVMMTQ